jgi:DNA-binding protein H-NS
MQLNENSSTQEIKNEIARLQQLLKTAEERALVEAREQIQQILNKLGKSAEEVIGSGGGSSKKQTGPKSGGKVDPKWIHNDGVQTWSGRGRKPSWVDTEGRRIDEPKADTQSNTQQ